MGPLEPQQLLEAAALLGIDHSNPSQTHLLAVARAYIELPLPDAWERSVNDQGKAAYVNKRTHKTSAEHPQLDQFEHLVSRLASQPPSNHELLTCMEFQHADGATFVHDFRPEQEPVSAPAAEQQGEADAAQPAATLDEAIIATPAQQQPAADAGSSEEPASAEATLEATASQPAVAETDQAADAAPSTQDASTSATDAAASVTEAASSSTADAAPSATDAAASTVDAAPSNIDPEFSKADAAPSTADIAPSAADDAPPETSVDAPAPTADPAPASDAEASASAHQEPSGQTPETPETSRSHAPVPEHQLIPPVPSALLEAFGIINSPEPPPEPMGDTGVRPGVKRLRYFSWWFEDVESTDLTFRVNSNSVVGGGLRKRYVTLDYNLDNAAFSLASANEDQELRMADVPVLTAKGEPAQIWDLHVGATLCALGKKLTLHKADLETASWNDRHAARLRQVRKELLAELQKYKPRAHPTALVFERGDRAGAGGLSLRHTVDQLNTLANDLQQYRPSKAEQYRSRINIKC